MQIVILSGGPGKRFWPFSNDARSKQFLRLLPSPDTGKMESMIQRVVRQIREAAIDSPITIATNEIQRDPIVAQLGPEVDTVTEPSRRNTFPAICLACEYLSKVKKCTGEETIVVMPCDQFTETGYFEAVKKMAVAANEGKAELVIMGIKPDAPVSHYGYVIPEAGIEKEKGLLKVKAFSEKPSKAEAEKFIEEGAYWNGGVFAFKLKFLLKTAEKFVNGKDFDEIKAGFKDYPDNSFDRQVVEKCTDVAMVPFAGKWKDLGTWKTLLGEIGIEKAGKVVMDRNDNTHVLNELQLPILCVGTRNLVVAASPDGILISDKDTTDTLKEHTLKFNERPMYEERRWGVYQVIDHVTFEDGYETLTKRLMLNKGASISYQRHKHRNETWTFIDGEGIIVLDGKSRRVGRGETVHIQKEMKHALLALTPLSFIEVQAGSNLVESDIERYEWKWEA